MDRLRALQRLEFGPGARTAAAKVELEKLRAAVPSSILAHYERLVAHGKKGVAVARNGVCGECHLRIPSGTLAALVYTDEVSLCENCGHYLYLPENEPIGLGAPKATPPARTKRVTRRATHHVA